jgi:GDP-L-fucose synthase
MNLANKTVLVTGGAGFLGTHLGKKLKVKKPKKVIIPRSHEVDLRDYKHCLEVTKGVDLVIHLAARVGGIGYNQEHPAELFDDNILMGVNILRASHQNEVQKFVGVGTICSYPKFAPIPFREEDLWNGYPEETNAPYGMAKKMLIVQSQAYRQQYGFNSINILPVNLYGPWDNFSPESSHVIPALIRKFWEANIEGQSEVVVWGTGKATREFLYVEDAALGILLSCEKYDKSDPINLGSSLEISIGDLAKLISKTVGYRGKIVFDKSKPEGQPRRKLDVSKAQKEFNFVSKTNFEKGLKKTVDWYAKNIATKAIKI